MFLNTIKVYQFKTKNLEIKDYALCPGNVSKDFAINNMEKNIKRNSKIFLIDFNPIDTNNILDIHKHLMKRT